MQFFFFVQIINLFTLPQFTVMDIFNCKENTNGQCRNIFLHCKMGSLSNLLFFQIYMTTGMIFAKLHPDST